MSATTDIQIADDAQGAHSLHPVVSSRRASKTKCLTQQAACDILCVKIGNEPGLKRKTRMKIKLTPNEAGILLHRLTVPDCIAECLLDCDWFGSMATAEQIMDAASCLERQINKTATVCPETELEKLILADAVDGSTYFASMEDEVACGKMTHQRMSGLLRACDSLEQKLKSIGVEARNPRC